MENEKFNPDEIRPFKQKKVKENDRRRFNKGRRKGVFCYYIFRKDGEDLKYIGAATTPSHCESIIGFGRGNAYKYVNGQINRFGDYVIAEVQIDKNVPLDCESAIKIAYETATNIRKKEILNLTNEKINSLSSEQIDKIFQILNEKK